MEVPGKSKEENQNENESTTTDDTEPTAKKQDLHREPGCIKLEVIDTDNELNPKEDQAVISEDNHPVIVKIEEQESAAGDIHANVQLDSETKKDIIICEIINLDDSFRRKLDTPKTIWVYYFHGGGCGRPFYGFHGYSCCSRRPFYLVAVFIVLAFMYFLTFSFLKYVKTRDKEAKKYEENSLYYLIFGGVVLLVVQLLITIWRFSRRFPLNILLCLLTIWAVTTIITTVFVKYKWHFLLQLYHIMPFVMGVCIFLLVFTDNLGSGIPLGILIFGLGIVTYFVCKEYGIKMNQDEYFMKLVLCLTGYMLCWIFMIQWILRGSSKPFLICEVDAFTAAYLLYTAPFQIVISILIIMSERV